MESKKILEIINRKKNSSKVIIYSLIIIAFIIGRLTASETMLCSDYDFTNQNYSYETVSKMIKSYKNTLLIKSDIEVIIRYSTVFELNPIMVLAKMQMESDVVVRTTTNKTASWLRHLAMGYGLYLNFWKDGKKYYKYGGFDIQVFKACEAMRKHFDGWKQGKKVFVKDLKREVTPENAATYSMYLYTPFYGEHNVYNWKSSAIGNIAFISTFERMKQRHSSYSMK